MKHLAKELTSPLFLIFNMSLESGCFPKFWKNSYLVPVFKSAKKTDISNYRGIAIPSCIPKLFEAIINKELFHQMKNRIIPTQHGFFKGRSTTTNLLEFINFSLNAMDKGNYVETLYTDFSKGFDRIDIPCFSFFFFLFSLIFRRSSSATVVANHRRPGRRLHTQDPNSRPVY